MNTDQQQEIIIQLPRIKFPSINLPSITNLARFLKPYKEDASTTEKLLNSLGYSFVIGCGALITAILENGPFCGGKANDSSLAASIVSLPIIIAVLIRRENIITPFIGGGLYLGYKSKLKCTHSRC